MITADCPSRQTLAQYSIGKLPDDESEDLAGHLDSCPDCQATLLALDASDDTLLGQLRTPPAGDSFLDEPQFEAALAEAIALKTAPDADSVRGGDPRGSGSSKLLPRTIGEYEIIEELGHGGMGRVYKAWHTKLGRPVAPKVLTRGRAADPHATGRFAREMLAVGRVDHPNIVHAYDAREIDGTPVLVMELVDGLDLSEIVRRVGPLGVAEACEVVRQTAVALQCAHEHGLVHRDVKPSNVMLARSGEVKLLDLGLARFGQFVVPPSGGTGPAEAGAPKNDEITGSGLAMGTADYMAPEQASDSRSVDIRADLYSLGCTLYKLLCGRAPFCDSHHRGTFEKMTAHVQETPPPIRALAADVPEKLAAILDRLLAKAPDDRFATPGEVAEALAPFAGGADLVGVIEEALATRPGRDAAAADGSVASQSPSPATCRRPVLRRIVTSLAFLGAVAAAFAAGVLITIKKDGRTYHLTAPPGSHTTVGENGDAVVDLSGISGVSEGEPVASSAAGGTRREAISLAEAVRVFNARAKDDPVGKDQPPLTEEAVIGAIRWALLEPDRLPVSDKTLEALRKIVDTRRLPPGFDLEVITGFEPNDRMAFTKWSVRLRIPAEPSGTTCIGIREVMVGSHVLGEQPRQARPKPYSSTIQPVQSRSDYQSRPFATPTAKPPMQQSAPAAVPSAPAGAPFSVQRAPAGATNAPAAVPSAPAAAPPSVQRAPATHVRSSEGPPLEFGPVIEKVVNALGEAKGGEGIDLANGKLIDVPKEFCEWSAEERKKWNAGDNVDLVVERPGERRGEHDGGVRVLVPQGLKLGAVLDEAWENANREQLLAAIASPTPGYAAGSAQMEVAKVVERGGTVHYELSFVPATFAFQTRGGDLGVLQAIRFNEEPSGLRIRYKLAKPAGGVSDDVAIRGEWAVVSMVGVPLNSSVTSATDPEEVHETTKVKITADSLEMVGPFVAPFSAEYQLDAAATPRRIDLRVDGALCLGIYELDGNRLTICAERPKKDRHSEHTRPAEFVATGTGRMKLVLGRFGDADVQEGSRSPQSPNVDPVADFQALQGPWRVVRAETTESMEYRRRIERIDFRGGSLWMTYAKLPTRETFTYRIDPTKKPGQVDLFSSAKSAEDSPSYLGVYELGGDRLRLALAWNNPAVKGIQRPRQFDLDGADVVWELERLRFDDDEEAMEGSWSVLNQTVDGTAIADEKLPNKMFYFRGNTFSAALAYENSDTNSDITLDLSGMYVLEPSDTPKAITFYARSNPPDVPAWEAELPAIYRLDGDRLTIAYRKGGPRPEEFESTAGSGVMLIVLRREEPRNGGGPATPAEVEPPRIPAAVDPAADLEALEGEWVVTNADRAAADAAVAGIDVATHLVFDGKSLFICDVGEGRAAEWGYRLDPRANPKTVDLLRNRNGRFEDSGTLGLYEIAGDHLTIALSHAPSTLAPHRPASLAAGPDAAEVLLTLKRYQPTTDETAIEGDWAIVELTKRSSPVPAEAPDDSKPVSPGKRRHSYYSSDRYVRFEDHRVRFMNYQYGDELAMSFQRNSGFYVLNPASAPKAITMTFSPSMRAMGIYSLDGDRLTIAYSDPDPFGRHDDSRPEKFESPSGSRISVLVLERMKAAGGAKDEGSSGADVPKPPAPSDPASGDDEKSGDASGAPPAAPPHGPDKEAARIRLRYAEQMFQVAEERYKDGTIPFEEMAAAARDRDVAAAELAGDPLESARAKLRWAEQIAKAVEAKFEAGQATMEQALKAKRDRDLAAAEVESVEAGQEATAPRDDKPAEFKSETREGVLSVPIPSRPDDKSGKEDGEADH